MISVIVPYWNAESWLGRCLGSLEKQTGDLEFLIVNDMSTDNGEEIAEQYGREDDRFRLLTNEHAKGVSGARNTGIERAKGDWITFLDADDELLEQASRVFICMTQLDDTANIIQANHLKYYNNARAPIRKYVNERGVYTTSNLPRVWCMVWNKLIRKSFIDDTGVRFVEGLQYGEDEVFNLDMLSYDDRIFHTMRGTCTVLRHKDNAESLSHGKGWRELLIQSRALEDFMERTPSDRARAAACRTEALHWNSVRYQKAFEK